MKDYNIGILVDGIVYSGIRRNYPYFENVSFYEEAARRYNIRLCFFRLKDICFESMTVRGLVKDIKNKYKTIEIPIPLVIHNRGLFFTNKSKKKIKKLYDKGIVVFNEWNRYKKFDVHTILQKSEYLAEHLPETVLASEENLQAMLVKHEELMIKPNSGSLGGGILKISRLSDELWEMSYTEKRSGDISKETFFCDELPPLLKAKLKNKRYIIQERIPLATYKESPFDLRVSVQRNGTGNWQVTGIVAKVAKSGAFLTNVAKGGSCKPITQIVSALPQLNIEAVQKNVKQVSLTIVEQLSLHYPYLADVGLDIGLTSNGIPMFIECNGRDLRITFGKANMIDTWKETYVTPISYGRYLLDEKFGRSHFNENPSTN